MSITLAIAIGTAVGATAAAAAAVAASKRRRVAGSSTTGSVSIERERPSGCNFDAPIAVGYANEPEVAALLDEMDALFARRGVDLEVIDAREVTTMPKAPGKPVAIPPRAWWPSMADTIVYGYMPIRYALGVPVSVRGYRPPSYNEAVGGADCSRHQAFEGLDIYAPPGLRRELALLGAQLYRDHGKRLKVGFGVYGYPNPSNIHVDVGHERRTWRESDAVLADYDAGARPQTPLSIPGSANVA